jgi:hypothetical protein
MTIRITNNKQILIPQTISGLSIQMFMLVNMITLLVTHVKYSNLRVSIFTLLYPEIHLAENVSFIL